MEGRISRRTLVRRLMAGGVSAGAAVSYAHMLAPERAEAASNLVIPGDHYPLIDLSITSTSLATVRAEKALQIRALGSEELVNAFIRIFVRSTTGGVIVGAKVFPTFMATANNRSVKIPIHTPTFAGQNSVRFHVQMSASDNERYPALANAAVTLS